MNSRLIDIKYRKDIDGLRALAVISVIIFHIGFLPLGYLGVDIFFVISGYLITKIIYRETVEEKFSLVNFYLRRIRRIIPLVLFTVLSSMIVAVIVMLPDDLENFSQSVLATNFMVNNILLLITTGNYWDSVNEFKPLMHTWSLGIEGQFYFIVPLIFLVLKKKRIKNAIWLLAILSIVSLMLLPYGSEASKFYLIQYRFFEIAVGGILGIYFKDNFIKIPFRYLLFVALALILTINVNLPPHFVLILVVFITTILLISKSGNAEKLILENKYVQFIGKISFSLYMWHQIVLAFYRYFIFSTVQIFPHFLYIIAIALILSILTYYFIETPFRNKKIIGQRALLISVFSATLITSGVSFYLYSIKGIIRDVPELNLYQSETYNGNIHIKYNEDIYQLSKEFENNKKTNILIIGDSFARDWANVLQESKYGNAINISYVDDISLVQNLSNRFKDADVVFFSRLNYTQFEVIAKKFNINRSKVWNIGDKSFGTSNGIFYNKERDDQYYTQRTKVDDTVLEKNKQFATHWKSKYINILDVLIDAENKVPIFTPYFKYISEDCTHLTAPGAKYLAKLLENQLPLYLKGSKE